MTIRILSGLSKWLITLLLLGVFLELAYLIQTEVRKERAKDQAGDKLEAAKRDDNPGEITLPLGVAEALGLESAPAKDEGEWLEPVTVFGRVVPNPQATVDLRAAFAGSLRRGSGAWPALGQWLRAGDPIGVLEVRVGPQERLDLENKLNEARQKYAGAVNNRKIWQTRVERLQLQPKSLTPKELEEAQLQLTEGRTQEAVAEEAFKLWEKALNEIGRPSADKPSTWSQPLRAPFTGEVTELPARPDVAVEAGALLARVVDFRQPLVRLDLPPEVLGKGPPPSVELTAAALGPAALRGARNQPQAGGAERKVQATLVGPAPQVDAASQLAGYFYDARINGKEAAVSTAPLSNGLIRDGVVWRPGLLVKAEVRGQGAAIEPREAVSVPATALLFHQGRALVYVRQSPDDEKKRVRFARREVEVLGRSGDRWVLAKNIELLDVGDEVVVKNARMLLSEEFKMDVDND